MLTKNLFIFSLDFMSYIVYSEAMYSSKEASQRMGISDSHLRRLLESGQVEGKKLGHDWVVLSLEYKRKRKPKRRQKNEES